MAFISLSKDRHQWLFLEHILEGQVVQDRKCKLQGHFEALKFITLMEGVSQDGGGISQEVSIELSHRFGVDHSKWHVHLSLLRFIVSHIGINFGKHVILPAHLTGICIDNHTIR